MPGSFWITSSASSALAVGLRSGAIKLRRGFMPELHPGTGSSGTDTSVPSMDNHSEAIVSEPPVAGTEVDTLLGALERQRGYLAWKCGNLDSAGLRATLGPSAMTLGGLLKHLAGVEDDVFSVKLHGRDPHPPWDTVDWSADPDWEWHSAAGDRPEELMLLWLEAVGRSRALVAEALAAGGLDRLASFTGSG